jgi:CDP-diacylglycerol--serine O-phosphatidyltransferase
MLQFLRDPANAITAFGLVLSAAALNLAAAGRVELGVAIALWAVLADHLDGVVARSSPDRDETVAQIGQSLDGFADLVYGSVFPASIAIKLGDGGPLGWLASTLLLVAGALRLSYFNVFGLGAGRRFTGLPLSYAVPALAVVVLLQPVVPPDIHRAVLWSVLFTLALLHVTPVAIAAPGPAMYLAITLFCVLSSLILAYRGLS